MNILKPLIKADDHVRGSTNAIITLVEFGDFECSHCGSAYWFVKQLLVEFEGKLRFIYRYFPLREIHPNAYIAALAAEAANRQGKFWEMHDFIYENQKHLD